MRKGLGPLMIGLFFFMWIFRSTACADEPVKVMVFPFKINALDEFSYLASEIPKIIEEDLNQAGALLLKDPIDSDKMGDIFSRGEKSIRAFGIQKTADYVIWGSLTWIGERFSLDANVLSTKEDVSPEVFFQEGEGIENLLGSVKTLVRNISATLFHWEKVADLLIEGNQRIEDDAIKRVIQSLPGEIFLSRRIPEDIKAIYNMGYFDDIRVEVKDLAEGKQVIFILKEKPTIRQVFFNGNKVYEDKEILKEIDIKSGSILNIFRVQENIKQIVQLYKDKNYHNVNVTYTTRPLQNNQADLVFVIQEGPKLLIKEIKLIGNDTLSSDELKDVMKTSEKGFWSWITSSGDLKIKDLEEDIERLSAFYMNNGYVSARIGEPQIDYQDKWIYVTIKIDEGIRYKVGQVDISGDLIVEKSEILKMVKISNETYFNREVLREDILAISDLYAEQGYANTDIVPNIDPLPDGTAVNITFSIQQGKQVYFERIDITGNTKTRDKVIRRELMVYEQSLYNSAKLKRSIRNLNRLDFFEEVNADTLPGSADDKMVLKIDVTEKGTGMFNFGAGYSSGDEGLFAQASISDTNLFGRGQNYSLSTEIGQRTVLYTLSFTEPWLFDIPLAAGIDLYNWSRDYDTYEKESSGFGLRSSYQIFDYTRAYLSYAFDIGDVRNISIYAAEQVKQLEGNNVTSSISGAIRYDSRDRLFNPTEGANHSITVTYAGLGGDIGYVKTILESGTYFPIYKKLVGFIHAKGGLVRQVSDMILPDYERFFLGGMNSLRGFDWRDISPVKMNSMGFETKIGGDKFVQFNVEALLPLGKKTGVVGVIFYDTGDVYDNHEPIDFGSLRQSAGFGIRWYSPMGPLRIEYGHILNAEPGESSGGRWDFSMGHAF